MTREIDFQKELIDVVRAEGGFGIKLSHRFLVGVPDLLVKLPTTGAILIECKRDKLPVKLPNVIVSLTAMQHRYLGEARAANMGAGVVVFLHRDDWFTTNIFVLENFNAYCGERPVAKIPVAAFPDVVPMRRRKDMMAQLIERLGK